MMMQTLNNLYKEIQNCLCCNNTTNTILDLGNQPPANSYIKNLDEQEISFPLRLNYCSNCTHLQLSHAVNPDILFKHYLYVSGTTSTLKKYFDEFVDISLNYSKKSNNLKILDIACNDGSQLDSFKKRNYQTYGIDPATNLFELSNKNHNVVCDYFSKESVSKFNTKFDIIVAQNVFAHNSYPGEFLDVCYEYLNNDGVIFIQTSQADMIEQCQFDTIYHEHISFFNANSMNVLVNRHKLFINDILKVPIHGNSYIFVISKQDKRYSIYSEQKLDNEILEKFVHSVNSTISSIKSDIENFMNTEPDGLVIGYGAAAKGNTVLNYGKIKLDYIVDDNLLKQGLYTPGMKIPIVSLSYINNQYNTKKIAWLPLSWNFFDEIQKKIMIYRKNNNDVFLKFKFANS